MKIDDSVLIAKIKEGNEEACELVFKGFFIPLCSYARKYVVNLDDAKDIVQFTFIKFWELRQGLADDTNIEYYLYRSVGNNCLDWIKHQKVKLKFQQKILESRDESYVAWKQYEENSIGDQLEKDVLEAIDGLPEQCRRIFTLSRFEGKKYHEIANQLQISIKTVETQMSRALIKLREKLAKYLVIIILIIKILKI